MKYYITYVSTVFLLSFHILAGEGMAQSRIDSIKAEVEALNKYYQQEITALYKEMLALSKDEGISRQERAKQ